MQPSYLEKGDAEWNFMRNIQVDARILEIPPGAFELRYRIELMDKPVLQPVNAKP